MEPLLKQLRELPNRFSSLPANVRRLILGGIVAAVAAAAVAAALLGGSEGYQYVFTNLTSEDGAEAAAALKAAKIPFRTEASGAALSVPASQVYEARLLLATAGLPRGGGVGFELFDRGDLGVSEFTQKVNLRRAIEGELARTIGRLAEVRSARVHLTLPEKGLFRDDERKGSAAVVLNLHPGRSVGERELAGIRHLVASAVPGLGAETVTIVDGKGTVLGAESSWGEAAQSWEKKLERDLEARVVGLLEPMVGSGAVVARVTASVDASEVDTQQESFDPDSATLRSDRKVVQTQTQDSTARGGVAGAAANQPLPPAPAATASGSRGASSLDDEIRNFEISKTVTKTVARSPRLKRLSVAIALDGVDGKPRPAEEVTRLGELAKKAVGFDETRGDQLEISSAAFARSTDATRAPDAAIGPRLKPLLPYIVAGAVALALLGAVVVARRRARAKAALPVAQVLPAGAKVGDLIAGRLPDPNGAVPAPAPMPALEPAPVDPVLSLQERARHLATQDPSRAVHLLRAWMADDSDVEATR